MGQSVEAELQQSDEGEYDSEEEVYRLARAQGNDDKPIIP